jgi:hypothetical protein
MSTRSCAPSRLERLAVALVLLSVAGCGEGEPEPEAPSEARELLGLRVTSRDGRLSAVIPGAYIVHRQRSALLAAPADGGARLYLARLPERTVAAALGAHKDDVLGLGAEILEERHFERATRLVAEEGPRAARQRRRSWLVDDGAGGVILCEGFFPPDDELSWLRLIDAVCLEARAVGAPPARPAAAGAPAVSRPAGTATP